MAEPRTYTTAICPVCAWYCTRSYFLPKHLVKHHPADIIISKAYPSHYLHGYVKDKKEELEFSVCLTCSKGFLGDAMTAQASRWINSHYMKQPCKKEHKTAFAAFKLRQSAALTEQPVLETPEEQTSGSALTVWNQLKSKPDYKDLCVEFESDDKEKHDGDSENEEEYMFDPAKGILKLFTDASAFKKNLYKVTASVNKIEAKHKEKEGILFNKIIELEEIIANTKFTEIESYNRREMLKMELEDADKQLKPPVSIE